MNLIAKSIVIRTSAEWFLCMVNSLCCLCTSVTLLLTTMCSGVSSTHNLPQIGVSRLSCQTQGSKYWEDLAVETVESSDFYLVTLRLLKVHLNYKRQLRRARLLSWFRGRPHRWKTDSSVVQEILKPTCLKEWWRRIIKTAMCKKMDESRNTREHVLN